MSFVADSGHDRFVCNLSDVGVHQPHADAICRIGHQGGGLRQLQNGLAERNVSSPLQQNAAGSLLLRLNIGCSWSRKFLCTPFCVYCALSHRVGAPPNAEIIKRGL